jgi:ketosteroid isomerase-like protein
MTDEDAVLELEAKRIRAMIEGDPETMLSILHDDHVHVRATGVPTDKQGAAEGVRNPGKIVPGENRVRVYGDIAIVTGPQTNYAKVKDEEVQFDLFVTRVAIRTEDGWKFVSMHATPRRDLI